MAASLEIMNMDPERRILWEVAEEHLDEAAFLFERWDHALDSPLYRLDELAGSFEARTLAHIEGLAAGGQPVRARLLEPLIGDTEADPGQAVIAAAMLLNNASSEDCGSVLEVLDGLDGFASLDEAARAHWRALTRAVELSERPGLVEWLGWGLSERAGPGLATRLRGLAARGVVADARAVAWLNDDDPAVVAAACHLARGSQDPAVLDALRGPLMAEALGPRLAALDAACVTRPAPIFSWVLELAWAGEGQLRERARLWAALLGGAGVHARLLAAVMGAGVADLKPASLWPLAFTGRLAAVDFAVELMAHQDLEPDLARAAGELCSHIAGLPEDDRYWLREDEDEDADENEDEDEDEPELEVELVPGPIADLRLPNPDEVRSWWAGARAQLDERRRYLGGVAMDGERFMAALRTLPCRRRHPLSLELAARSGGQRLLDTRVFSRRQYAQLEQLAQLPAIDPQASLAS
ncbi:hypothetical protein G6O69_33835 [Pseudenhygromyxa sp. WMMC2535]|uniref:hypothetical protein n=1 Tax=Pseudenhygromyxa sp. WMMC2535 TaxID=2712867 RepID=UPI001553698E|nr:hypothetical protein [Pseudenhygromyxa sp. WMMC2535]NVB42851.1 hypothetical protein [Pseudenhygromyxa sp. WMMC2535]